MSTPTRAAVRPRAMAPTTGLALPLEDLVADSVARGDKRPIQILGGPGSGKSTALLHLQAVLPEIIPSFADHRFVFLDEPDGPGAVLRLHLKLHKVVFATSYQFPGTAKWTTLQLAPWTEDDCAEYLCARYKPHCAAVITGLRQGNDAWRLEGVPQLWTLTLDYLATRQAGTSAAAALRAAVLHRAAGAELARAAEYYSLGGVVADFDLNKPKEVLVVVAAGGGPEMLSLLRHMPLRKILAVSRIAADLGEGRKCPYLRNQLPRELVQQVAEQVRNVPAAHANLRRMLTQKQPECHAMAASIYHGLDRHWLRNFPHAALPQLDGAYLDHADWPGLRLAKASLSGADLSFANLADANLNGAAAQKANFREAILTGARMQKFDGRDGCFVGGDLRNVNAAEAYLERAVFRQAKLDGASFFGAELQHADFSNASLVGASFAAACLVAALFDHTDCTRADFSECELDGADLRTAQLDGARFHATQLPRCNLEEITLPAADFSEANLRGALLTASYLPHSNFADADLRDTGLAHIEWEGADLRAADLRGASFHLGSSRSGLVGSPIAREGSMTGFYTDDYAEQDFKAPEEIRKANLRGADLRAGANIDDVDFYLVDLRDAYYDEDQARHFRASKAILQYRGDG